jgi:hypothetical protein
LLALVAEVLVDLELVPLVSALELLIRLPLVLEVMVPVQQHEVLMD